MPRETTGRLFADRAHRYEAMHRCLFLLRILLILFLLIGYHQTGASAELADGLQSRFGDAWGRMHLLYLVLTLFGYYAILFPLSLYEGFVVEHRFGQSTQTFRAWFGDSLKEYVVDLILFLLFFLSLYVFLRLFPATWWMAATGLYVIGVVFLAFVAPVVLLPFFFKVEPLDDPDLAAGIAAFFERSRIPVAGVFRWGLGEKTRAANAALVGLGASRRILLSDTLLEQYSKEEIMAVLAHEAGHQRHGDIPRLLALSTGFAALIFLLTHLALNRWIALADLARNPADIALFPLLALCLFVFSILTLPLLNAYSRRREYAADAYAVAAIGDAEPLVTALERMTDQNLVDPWPPRWVETLLLSHPSMGRRAARARDVVVPSESST